MRVSRGLNVIVQYMLDSFFENLLYNPEMKKQKKAEALSKQTDFEK